MDDMERVVAGVVYGVEGRDTPPDVTAQERWIVNNRVAAIRAEHRQTGTATSESYLHLKPWVGKEVCWLVATFRSVAQVKIGTGTLTEPVYGLHDKVRAREKWEAANTSDLADYKRLKAKFEGGRGG